MSSSTADSDEDEPVQEIRLVDDGEWWVATDIETGIASQGKTREAVLMNLDEAVALHRGEIGKSIDSSAEEREVLREMGIDPDEIERSREDANELPEFMR